MVRKLDANTTSSIGTQASAPPVIAGNTAKQVEIPGQRDVGIKRSLVPLEPNPQGPSVKQLFPIAVQLADLQTAESVATVLAKQLGQPGLEVAIQETVAAAKPKDRAAMLKTLAAYAVLVDEATTMMDYSKLTRFMGWEGFSEKGDQFPISRNGYRKRAYRPRHELTSEPRQQESRRSLGAALHEALGAKQPAKALDAALVDRFYAELGLPAEVTQGWAAQASAVQQAMAHEALIPLRALYDATLDLQHLGVGGVRREQEPFLNAECRKAVIEIIKHVAEGDFESWRFDSSHEQLKSLSAEQLAAYRTSVSIERVGIDGKKLTTRDEQGLDLMWLTKIAGPSHGFDMISQCLLPLLGNGRNGAIVIDQEGWPRAARSTLRMLEGTDGKPMLYVEMLQVDFEHPRTDDVATRQSMRLAILQHAAAKAKAMGVPLVIAPSKYEVAENLIGQLGLKGERKEVEIRLAPSNMVFESSDTLTSAHHAPQMQEKIVVIPNWKTKAEMARPYPMVIQP